MRTPTCFRLHDGTYLVISLAGVATIVQQPEFTQARAALAAEELRRTADAIERASAATAPILIPNRARSITR